LDEESRLKRYVKAIGAVIAIIGIIALGIYLSATQTPTYTGKTVIRWVVDPNPIRKETIALFESRNPEVHVINDPDAGAQLLFAQGKVAMMFIGRFLISEYRKQTDLEFGVVDLPRGPKPMNLFLSKTYSIPKTCRNKVAAVKFIKHILGKENQLLIAEYGDGLPTRQDKEITKGFLYNPEYPKETNNQIYIDSLKTAMVAETSQYINSSDLDAIVNRELGNMWLGEQSSDQTCDNIAEQVNAIIRRNIANPNFLD
jgi:ABC-type glycerol-3-phosphate transport system substrate-binding protein